MGDQQRAPENGLISPAGDQARTRAAAGATRRRLLQASLVAGAAASLGACRNGVNAAPRPVLRQPGSRPDPRLPAGTDTLPQIKHIVVLTMENHSYDNHLGMLQRPGADGFKLGSNGKPLAVNPYSDGRLQHAFRMPTTCQLPLKPNQTWTNTHIQLDGGKLDGFVKSGSGPVSMGYWQRADLPFYYSLASVFPLADRYFCSVLGQTFPNRRYLIAATSIGMINDTFPSLTGYPANGTIFDSLHKAHVSWKDYYSRTSVVPTLALFPKLLVRYQESEEDPQNIALGEEFAAKVINAVMTGPGWKNTLLIWTFDEHGGYYDHVVPPRAIAPDNIPPAGPSYTGFHQYGFRVPCVVVSPWARPNYVSHQVFDHTSICALVEKKWNLPAMTRRDANAHNMLDMLDLSAPAFKSPPKLDKPLLDAHPTAALKCSVTGPGPIPPPGSISPAP